MKHRGVLVALSILLLLALVGNVRASNVFTIEPLKEVTQAVQATSGCQSIAGNVSVVGGTIDFYVTNPLGANVFECENVSFKDFSVNTAQNGTYVIHLVNRWSVDNVTATLFYGRNFVVALSSTVTWHTVATMTMALSTSSSGWIGIVSSIQEFIISVARETVVAVLSMVIGTLLLSLILKKHQKWKDGSPSKTPSTMKPRP